MDNVFVTVCLNMIVKNESQIIYRLLESVFPYIDYYCICDTGSTDNTVQLIKEFFDNQGRQIEGEIIHHPFKDFGYNRSVALKACDNIPADFVLLLDADMVFECKLSPFEFRNKLKLADAHYIFQGGPGFHYKNTRIVRNHRGFSYWGVTHEYVQTPNGTIYKQFDTNEVFINDVGDGGSKGNKHERDIKLLLQGLIENPKNDRYTFYLANSYSDIGDNENAIKYYKQRIEVGGWMEEIWSSHYKMGLCYETLGDMPSAIYHWLEAYNKFPNRIENLYEIIRYYRVQGNCPLAYHFYKLANAIRTKNEQENKTDFLFYKKHITDYQLDYELSIIGYYYNPDNINLNKVFMKVLGAHGLEHHYYLNTLSNYKFIVGEHTVPPTTPSLVVSKPSYVFGPVREHSREAAFDTSTPSICRYKDGYITCTRFVNYHIDDNGNYINQEHIVTKNVISVLDQDKKLIKEFVLDYDKQYDGRYVGQEDIRLFCVDNCIYYTCNRGINQENGSLKICVEFGAIDLDAEKCINSVLLYKQDMSDTEKNWVLFQSFVPSPNASKLRCVYKWSPLTIGTIGPMREQAELAYASGHLREETKFLDANGPQREIALQSNSIFTTIHQQDTSSLPRFFTDLRGSTNGVTLGNETWFICHLVSYEERRYYYHCMVVLDNETLNIKCYSPLWKFGDDNKVEYTLGFVYENASNTFIIGYSAYDKTTNYIQVPKGWFDDTMIFVSGK